MNDDIKAFECDHCKLAKITSTNVAGELCSWCKKGTLQEVPLEQALFENIC